MKIKRILIFLCLLPLVSCSLSQIIGDPDDGEQDNQQNQDRQIASETANESEEKVNLISEEEKNLTGTGLVNDNIAQIEAEDLLSGQDTKGASSITPSLSKSALYEEIPQTEGEKKYLVEENDTLMWVAFKLYGNYSKWRELAQNNGLQKNASLRKGMNLKYFPPVKPFAWNPKGSPYLIKMGDSLGKISHSVYGTNSKWKFLWENNRDMIKNPNLIFVGFTLYYLPLGNEMAVK